MVSKPLIYNYFFSSSSFSLLFFTMANNQLTNVADPTKPFTLLHLPNTIKLTLTNYIAWKAQLEAQLLGHDLYKYVDGSFPSPPASITDINVYIWRFTNIFTSSFPCQGAFEGNNTPPRTK